MPITIYHNPRCATSRKALGLAPRQLLRKKEAKEAGLDKPSLSDAEIIAGMEKHPIAIERPIVTDGKRAVLGRPPEKALDLI
jgi:arsenate reductase